MARDASDRHQRRRRAAPLEFCGNPGELLGLRDPCVAGVPSRALCWLQLESPSSAAITVAILALPTRGQGLEKAGYRLLATVVGVVASIAGIFSQTDGLLFGIWIGLCAYAAGMLDGNRAYAAVLCCITVALIAIQQVDGPLQVFPRSGLRSPP